MVLLPLIMVQMPYILVHLVLVHEQQQAVPWKNIRQLCDYAHQFGAKVHVTVNTIIYQDEMLDTLKMIQQLDEIGVDALLLQDMGVLTEVRAQNLWSRELHSSTQCDVRNLQKRRIGLPR